MAYTSSTSGLLSPANFPMHVNHPDADPTFSQPYVWYPNPHMNNLQNEVVKTQEWISHLGSANIADFGALSNSISTDAFIKAINSLPNGGTIIVPQGTFLKDALVELPADKPWFVKGLGWGSVVKGSNATDLFKYYPTTYPNVPLMMENLKLNPMGAGKALDFQTMFSNGAHVSASIDKVWFENKDSNSDTLLRLYNARESIVKDSIFWGGGNASKTRGAVTAQGTINLYYQGCRFLYCGTGLSVTPSTDHSCEGTHFQGGLAIGSKLGLYVDTTYDINVTGMMIDSNISGVEFNNVNSSKLVSCFFGSWQSTTIPYIKMYNCQNQLVLGGTMAGNNLLPTNWELDNCDKISAVGIVCKESTAQGIYVNNTTNLKLGFSHFFGGSGFIPVKEVGTCTGNEYGFSSGLTGAVLTNGVIK